MQVKRKNIRRHILVALVGFFAIVLIGALIFGSIEDLDFTDSFYATMMTVTTIGYGDIVPLTNGGKVFVSLYSLVGFGAFLYIFSEISGARIEVTNT